MIVTFQVAFGGLKRYSLNIIIPKVKRKKKKEKKFLITSSEITV